MRVPTKISKKLFFLLVLFLPLNLGKHFVIPDSYVWGILSDYLIPTIYIQDLLSAAILLFWLLEKGFPSGKTLTDVINRRSSQLVILFIAAVGFSVLGSARLVPSFGIFLRLALYSLLAFYVSCEIVLEKDFPIILTRLSLSLLVLGAVAVIQFSKQGSVFNNYLFFGEQPYISTTWGVVREEIVGVTKIPAYGFFRHPNVFGGFLSVVLVWVYSGISSGNRNNKLLKLSFGLGLISLLLTFSYVAWVGFIAGFLSYLFVRYYDRAAYLEKKKKITAAFLGMVLIVNLLVPLFTHFQQPSLYRRGSLFASALEVIGKYPLFGTGPGNFVTFVNDFRFVQPVHNIFLLVFSESGVFSFALFVLIFIFAIRISLNRGYFFLPLISLLQILFEGSLDHYFWTMQQTLLLMWILLGLVFKEEAQPNTE